MPQSPNLSTAPENAGARDEIHFEANTVRILEQHGIVAGRPRAFGRRAHDRRAHLAQQFRASIHVLTRAGTQAQMM